MMFFSPCCEFTTLISWVTAPLELGGIDELLAGSISSLRYLGTAAWEEHTESREGRKGGHGREGNIEGEKHTG
jgi:hypothetical protein